VIKTIQSFGKWVVEEDDLVYGDYLEMVDKKFGLQKGG